MTERTNEFHWAVYTGKLVAGRPLYVDPNPVAACDPALRSGYVTRNPADVTCTTCKALMEES